MYTSHMTGFALPLAGGVVFTNLTFVLNALGAIFAFMVGAAVNHQDFAEAPLLREDGAMRSGVTQSREQLCCGAKKRPVCTDWELDF
jgi:hypothetical protein